MDAIIDHALGKANESLPGIVTVLTFLKMPQAIEMKEESGKELQKAKKSLVPVLLFVCLLWLIKIYEYFTHSSFSEWGNYPLHASGLAGIIFSPMLHSGFMHLLSNTGPVLMLGITLLYFYERTAYSIIAMIWLGSGLLVWLFGRTNHHIGASGLIYGLAAFLFFTGFIRRNNALLAISLLVCIFYGGLVWGVLPVNPSISWESHLSGAIMGLACAWFFRNTGPQQIQEEDTNNEGNSHELWDMEKIKVPPPIIIEHEEAIT